MTAAASRGVAAAIGLAALAPSQAAAQRAGENAVVAAQDAFGTGVGNERIGVYNEQDVRGFSPLKAGNLRLDGVYFDPVAPTNSRMRTGFTIRVGVAAIDYTFPAPTGIVDFHLRTSGDKRVISTSVSSQVYGGASWDVDAQIPVIKDRLSVAVGWALDHQEAVDGAGVNYRTLGIIPRFHFEGGEITPVVGLFTTRGGDARPVIVAANGFLPPFPNSHRYLGQSWAENSSDNGTVGVITRFRLGDSWSVRAGVFDSFTHRKHNYSELFFVERPDGSGRHSVVADPVQDARSYSGEAQLVWNGQGLGVRHRLLLMVRARDRVNETGGGDGRDLGPVVLGALDPEAKPQFRFSAVDHGTIRQVTGGVNYVGRIEGAGQINVGLQKSDYRASFRQAARVTASRETPWLYNAAVVAHPRKDLSVYASLVRGLEESGLAPENATNRNEQLDASLTTQIDGGIRYARGHSRLVLSAFSIEKPYFSFNAVNVFTSLGTVRHRGVEASYSTVIGDKLNLIAGAVLMRPTVTGEARRLGRVGARPVGVTPVLARLDADYRPGIKGLSFSAAVAHTGRRAASTRTYAELGGQQLQAPAFTTVDLGARYRFTVRNTPMSLRALVSNVFDVKAWKILAANSYQQNDTRRVLISLIADF